MWNLFYLLLSLTCLVRAGVIPQAVNASNIDTRDGASGYRSVAYFVNWVSLHEMRVKKKKQRLTNIYL